MEHSIRLENISKMFEGQRALDRVDLAVRKNEVVSVIGPSGAGKTTLLRVIAGLEGPDEGNVVVNGKVGMVFQNCHLWPHKTVLENVTEALNGGKTTSDHPLIEAKAMLEKLGLSHKLDAYPDTLSGGEAQRVAIARMLVTNPDVILCDEITSALDPARTKEVLDYLKAIAKDKVLVVVTHEMEFAKEISDRVVFLQDGKIMEQGHPWKIFSSPENEATRMFLTAIKR